MINTFKTSKGEKVKGKRLKFALLTVAQDWRANANSIREEDEYAPHVTFEEKEKALDEALMFAHSIEDGSVLHNLSFTVWQRINEELTNQLNKSCTKM